MIQFYPAHDVGIHFRIGVFHLWINGDTLDAIERHGLQHRRVLDPVISAEGGQGSAHPFGPVTGSEYSATVGDSFNNNLFHGLTNRVVMSVWL